MRPFGRTAPGLVAPKLVVPINGTTWSAGDAAEIDAAEIRREEAVTRLVNRIKLRSMMSCIVKGSKLIKNL